MVGGRNRDKKHCCFHLKLIYGVNSGLKLDNTSRELLKVVYRFLNDIFSILLSFFLNIKIPPQCPPVRYNTGHIENKNIYTTVKSFLTFFVLSESKSFFSSSLV